MSNFGLPPGRAGGSPMLLGTDEDYARLWPQLKLTGRQVPDNRGRTWFGNALSTVHNFRSKDLRGTRGCPRLDEALRFDSWRSHGIERQLLHSEICLHLHVRGGSAFMTEPQGNDCKVHADASPSRVEWCAARCDEVDPEFRTRGLVGIRAALSW